MNVLRRPLMKYGVLMACMLALGGCAIATDLLNPNLLASLGLDSVLNSGSTGTLVIAFKNASTMTITEATVEVTASDAPYADLADSDIDTLDIQDLAAGQTRTLVVDCPIAAVYPRSAAAAGDTGSLTVEYTGVGLFAGADYRCGDVIEFEVSQGANGPALFVRVIPGR